MKAWSRRRLMRVTNWHGITTRASILADIYKRKLLLHLQEFSSPKIMNCNNSWLPMTWVSYEVYRLLQGSPAKIQNKHRSSCTQSNYKILVLLSSLWNMLPTESCLLRKKKQNKHLKWKKRQILSTLFWGHPVNALTLHLP